MSSQRSRSRSSSPFLRPWIVRASASFAGGLMLAALLVFAPAAAAQGGDNSLRVRVGQFTPDADSEYWDENFSVFTGDEDDFAEPQLGIDFLLDLGPGAVLFSGDFYDSEVDQAYLDFIDAQGFDILHTTTLSVNSATVGYILQFAPGARIQPYLGAGGGIYVWELEEEGDFIDFFPADPEIFNTVFSDEGEAFGWYWVAGLEVELGPQWGAFVEGRGHDVDDELAGDFEGLGDLDLSGLAISGGVSFRF